jgi:hypothetical protein
MIYIFGTFFAFFLEKGAKAETILLKSNGIKVEEPFGFQFVVITIFPLDFVFA